MSEIPKVKRVLIFSLAYFPNVGGAEVAIKEITDRTSGIEFDLVAFNLNKNSSSFERVGRVNVYRVGGLKSLYPVMAFWKGYALHRKNKYSLVWSMMAAYGGFAGLFFKNVFSKVPFLLTLQEGDPEEHILKRVGIFYPLWKDIFKKADFIQVISNHLAEFAKRHGAKGKIEVVPNGVDLNKFSNSNFKFSKKDLNFNEQDKILITTSRLEKKNGVGDIIEALQYLPGSAKLLVLGIGSLESDLKLKIKNLKLDGRIKMLGYVDHADLPKYLHISDVFIRPALSEGLGNSFLEAMAAGLPVIGTNVGGIPDFLKDPSNASGQVPTGLFCEVNNPKSIAEKAMILFSDSELRGKLILNGKKLVLERYEWGIVAKDMEKIFDQLFANRSHLG